MRIYDDPVEVRRGEVDGPEQFLWHGRVWKVRTILAHWVETGEWWQPAKEGGDQGPVDLLREREWWRVEAGRGGSDPAHGWGVFELFFDWSAGAWRLAGCLD